MTQDAATSGAAARGTTVYLNGNAGEELVKKGLLKPEGLKIGLIGSCPPPYGGVTVHIQRLMKKLDEYDIDYVLYDVLGGQRKQKE